MPLKLTIVTAQRTILPSHAALMSSLAIGEMLVFWAAGPPEPIAIHGGFIQVARDEVSVLADAAERAEQIDIARAEAARSRAQARLEGRDQALRGGLDVLRAQLALQRSLARLRVARRRAGSATGAPSLAERP